MCGPLLETVGAHSHQAVETMALSLLKGTGMFVWGHPEREAGPCHVLAAQPRVACFPPALLLLWLAYREALTLLTREICSPVSGLNPTLA